MPASLVHRADPIPVQGQVITGRKSNETQSLRFPLTEIQVEGLATGQFVFQIPEQELGSYDVVALVPTFDPNTSAPDSDFQSPRQSTTILTTPVGGPVPFADWVAIDIGSANGFRSSCYGSVNL